MNYEDAIKEVYAQAYPYMVEVPKVGPGMAWCEQKLSHGEWGYFTLNTGTYFFCFRDEAVAVEFGLRFM